MRKKFNKKYLIIILLLLVITGGIFLTNKKVFKREVKIDKILESKDYAYLPYQAKDYVEKVYEDTGVIVPTEKNKEKNKPYLNPQYVDYLASEEKDTYEVIPKELVIDYVYQGTNNQEDLPSSFDLRSANGKNYVTPLRNQGELGICWSFATVAQAESYLLVKNDKSYDEDTTETFSERQIDYATSTDGIKDYTSEYNYERTLGDGGNFRAAMLPLMSDVSLVSREGIWETYDDTDKNQKFLHEVLNYDNSEYEVNSTIEMPIVNYRELDLTDDEDLELWDEYINTIKQNIMEYGGAYVGTQGPTYYCSAINSLDSQSKYVIDVDDDCFDGYGHALQIIGWDDNYEYKYCTTGLSHQYYTNTCSPEKTITGKGAWILKNSWGDSNTTYDYVYLAYASNNSDINFISDMKKTNTDDFDNTYFIRGSGSGVGFVKEVSKKIDTPEVIQKIKIIVNAPGRTYDIYISPDGATKNYELIESVYAEMPGIYTVDLSDKNIVLENEKYGIRITDSAMDEVLSVYRAATIFTNNVENDVAAVTKDAVYINHLNMQDVNEYKFTVYSDTKNIPSNSQLTYKLYDLDNHDLSTHLTYSHNYVAENNASSLLTVDNSVEPGNYKIKTYYNNEEISESNLKINQIKQIEGSGTEQDPYIITTPDELNMINEAMSAHYKLGNDIDLTEATREGGSFYNDGKGWIPIGAVTGTPFTGTLDGKNHSIIGLYMKSKYDQSGLFSNINGDLTTKNPVFIKNLFLVDFDISLDEQDANVQSFGMLAGRMEEMAGEVYSPNPPTVTIENIGIIGGKINSGGADTGSLLGTVFSSSKDHVFISNVFNSSAVDASSFSTGGIIGYVRSPIWNGVTNSTLSIKNIQNIGLIRETLINKTKVNVGGIISEVTGSTQLENVIATGDISLVDKLGAPPSHVISQIIGKANFRQENTYNASIKNTYYLDLGYDAVNADYEVSLNNVTSKTISQLKDVTSYTNWEDFDENWEIKEVDGITRIPVLKFVGDKFDYTSLTTDSFNINAGETVNIYDYILPDIEIAKNIVYEIADPTIATIDNEGVITGVKAGTTSIHITSMYDGYDNDIDIVVKGLPSITFDANGGTGNMIPQVFNFNTSKKITKNTFEREGYTFTGWNTKADGSGQDYVDEENISLEDDMTLYAQWTINKYTIKFVSESNVLQEEELDYGSTPEYKGETPTKESTAEYEYTFTGWDKEISPVTKAETYTAEFSQTKRKYNITFQNEDHTELSVIQVEYGTVPEYKGETPTKESTAEYTYTFAGWDKELYAVTKAETYIATYNSTKRKYTVTFYANNGTEDYTTQEIDALTETALEKNTSIKSGYTFIGWETTEEITYTNQQVVSLTANLTLYAKWEEGYPYTVNEYSYSEENNYISSIDINTTVSDYTPNIVLSSEYTMEVDYKTVDNKNVLYTGGKTKIYKNEVLVVELTNVVSGDTNGDGKVTYLDYVKVYNHIQKTKHPEINKQLLVDEFLTAADMSNDNKISYLDYVRIYNKIKELKGGSN